MDEGALVSEQIDAGARFLRGFHKYRPIGAAFWLKDAEEGHWYLHVASDQITDENFADAYGEVLQVARPNYDPGLDPFQVRLIGLDHRLAQAALAAQQRYTLPLPVRVRGTIFGGVGVDEVYIYPASVPVSAP